MLPAFTDYRESREDEGATAEGLKETGARIASQGSARGRPAGLAGVAEEDRTVGGYECGNDTVVMNELPHTRRAKGQGLGAQSLGLHRDRNNIIIYSGIKLCTTRRSTTTC